VPEALQYLVFKVQFREPSTKYHFSHRPVKRQNFQQPSKLYTAIISAFP
jgi:hypothetical protein